MTERINDSIERINALWGIHDPSESAPEGTAPCLAFAVDPRYVERDGVRFRLGVSFGGNPFTPEDAVGFVPPPVLPDRYVVGLHLVGTRGDRLTIYDQWVDARGLRDFPEPAAGLESARTWLAGMPDEEYASHLWERRGEAITLGREPDRPVEAFEVVGGEAF